MERMPRTNEILV